MKFIPRCFLPLVVVCFAVCAFAVPALGGGEWRAIDPGELSSKTATVEKDADAEVVFWEVRVDDRQPERWC